MRNAVIKHLSLTFCLCFSGCYSDFHKVKSKLEPENDEPSPEPSPTPESEADKLPEDQPDTNESKPRIEGVGFRNVIAEPAELSQLALSEDELSPFRQNLELLGADSDSIKVFPSRVLREYLSNHATPPQLPYNRLYTYKISYAQQFFSTQGPEPVILPNSGILLPTQIEGDYFIFSARPLYTRGQ